MPPNYFVILLEIRMWPCAASPIALRFLEEMTMYLVESDFNTSMNAFSNSLPPSTTTLREAPNFKKDGPEGKGFDGFSISVSCRFCHNQPRQVTPCLHTKFHALIRRHTLEFQMQPAHRLVRHRWNRALVESSSVCESILEADRNGVAFSSSV